MKKLILTLIFLTTVFAGYSQKDSAVAKKDTLVCVTVAEAINALKTSDSLRLAKQVIQEQDRAINLQKVAAEKDQQIIRLSTNLNDVNNYKIANLDKQVETLTKTNLLLLDNQAYLKNRLRYQKKKTFFITSAFVTIIGTGIYFLAK